MKDMLDAVNKLAEAVRDNNRPTIESIVKVIDDHVMKVVAPTDIAYLRRKDSGPDRYSWISSDGLRELSISGSALEGVEGYPLLTMRQVLCVPLDNQVTSSGLVVGSNTMQIMASIVTHLTNHAAAVAGVSAVSRVATENGDTDAELNRIEHGGRKPQSIQEAVGNFLKDAMKKDDTKAN